jgi:hypothetical protein
VYSIYEYEMVALVQRGCATRHHLLHRCILSEMYGAAAWHGKAGALGSVHYAVDRVGSARQAFFEASFNQNIGSWNTARVTIMFNVRALPPSHACGMQPESFSHQWSRPQVVPGADVGVAHLGRGRVPAQMWVRLGSTVNEP